MTADIIVNWGIKGALVSTTPTTWEVEEKYILKLVDSQKSVLSNIKLTEALRAQGVPVPHILKAKDGRDFIMKKDGCYLLMEKLAGSHIKDVFNQDFAAIAYETGIIVAKIHSVFMTVTDNRTDLPFFNEELQGWVSSGLSNTNLLMKEEWSGPIEELCCIYPLLPKQQIHRDLHYGNLLFEGTKLTGVLDFDLGKQDARLFDIAYFLLGQLSDQKDLVVIKDKWRIFISQFLSGYETVIILQEVEKNTLSLMMQCIELLFVVFWQQQGNQKSAEDTVRIFKFIEKVYRYN